MMIVKFVLFPTTTEEITAIATTTTTTTTTVIIIFTYVTNACVMLEVLIALALVARTVGSVKSVAKRRGKNG